MKEPRVGRRGSATVALEDGVMRIQAAHASVKYDLECFENDQKIANLVVYYDTEEMSWHIIRDDGMRFTTESKAGAAMISLCQQIERNVFAEREKAMAVAGDLLKTALESKPKTPRAQVRKRKPKQ